MSRSLENLVYTLIDRYLAGGDRVIGNARYHERHAVCTSFDPERYLAKVMFMPEQQESGWLPIETGHIGNSYGVAVGLQPGDGKKSGDQVIVRFQEGDLESGKIVQRVHSDDEKPPTVQSGEIIIWSKFKKSTGKSGLGDDTSSDGTGDDDEEASSGQGGSGQQIYFKNDGSVTWTDGNGATIVFDGKGNCTLTCNNLTENIKGKRTTTIAGNDQLDVSGTKTTVVGGDVGIKGGGNVEIKGGSNVGIDAGSEVIVQGGGSVSDGSVSPPGGQPSIPPFQVP